MTFALTGPVGWWRWSAEFVSQCSYTLCGAMSAGKRGPTVHVLVYRLASPCLNCPSSTVDILLFCLALAVVLDSLSARSRLKPAGKLLLLADQ